MSHMVILLLRSLIGTMSVRSGVGSLFLDGGVTLLFLPKSLPPRSSGFDLPPRSSLSLRGPRSLSHSLSDRPCRDSPCLPPKSRSMSLSYLLDEDGSSG